MPTPQQLELFNTFYYVELRSLTMSFLTLIVSVFTISVVFAEKVVVLTPPIRWRHVPIILAWVLFSIALALGGLGLMWLYVCGEIAHGSLIIATKWKLFPLLGIVYKVLGVAGLAFGGGIVLLAFSAVLKLFQQKRLI